MSLEDIREKMQNIALWKIRNMTTELDYEKCVISLVYLKLGFNDDLALRARETIKIVEKYSNESFDGIFESEEYTFEYQDYITLVKKVIDYKSGIFDKYKDLALELLDLNENDVFYDLGCGNGNMLVRAYEKCNGASLCGSEISVQDCEIAKMVLSIVMNKEYSQIESKCEISNENVFSSEDKSYTKAFLFPPFGIDLKQQGYEPKLSLQDGLTFNPMTSSDWFFVDSLISGLDGDDSKAIAFVTKGSIIGARDFGYRQSLLMGGYIESIIEMPRTIGMPFSICIIVLSKNNRTIKLIDANEMTNEEILVSYNSSEERDNVSIIDIGDEILSKSILPSNVQVEMKINSDDYYVLGEYFDVIQGSQYTLKRFEELVDENGEEIFLLTPGDLNEIKVMPKQSVTLREEKFDKFLIQDGDIIVTGKFSSPKVRYIKSTENKKILASGSLMILRKKKETSDVLDPIFVSMFLSSNNGEKQLNALSRGGSVKILSDEDLRNLCIPKVPYSEQKIKSEYYSMWTGEIVDYKTRINDLENKIKNLLNF